MRAPLQFEHGLSALEVMPGDQSRRLELGKGAIYGGQPDLLSGIEQFPVDGFGREMHAFDVLEKLEHLEPGQGGFQAGILADVQAGAYRYPPDITKVIMPESCCNCK